VASGRGQPPNGGNPGGNGIFAPKPRPSPFSARLSPDPGPDPRGIVDITPSRNAAKQRLRARSAQNRTVPPTSLSVEFQGTAPCITTAKFAQQTVCCANTPGVWYHASQKVRCDHCQHVTKDGKEKQDCELNAGKRWLGKHGKEHA
jgi:hypothetical protein